jgi:hypothetical protein
VQSSSPGEDQLVWGCPEKNKWCCNTGDVVPLKWRDGRTNTTCCSIPELGFSVAAAVYTAAAFEDPAFGIVTLATASQSSSTLLGASAATVSGKVSTKATVTSSPSASAAPDNAGPGPSSLAVGLGIGLGIFATVMVSIISILLWRRRNRNQHQHHGLVAGENWRQYHLREKSTPVEIGSLDSRMEMEDSGARLGVMELEAEVKPAELSAYSRKGR